MREFFMKVLMSPEVGAAFAGAAGGVVRTLTLRDQIWPDGVINLTVGALCATFLYPLVVPMLKIVVGSIVANEAQILGLSGFMIGIGGLAVTGFVIDFWRGWQKRVNNGAKPDGKPDA